MWKYHMSFALHMGWCLPFARRHMGDPETKRTTHERVYMEFILELHGSLLSRKSRASKTSFQVKGAAWSRLMHSYHSDLACTIMIFRRALFERRNGMCLREAWLELTELMEFFLIRRSKSRARSCIYRVLKCICMACNLRLEAAKSTHLNEGFYLYIYILLSDQTNLCNLSAFRIVECNVFPQPDSTAHPSIRRHRSGTCTHPPNSGQQPEHVYV